MAYRWPTDPPGKKPSHSISWQAHLAHGAAAQSAQQTAENTSAAAAYHQNQQYGAQVPGGDGGAPAAPAAPDVGAPPPDWQQIAAESAATRGVQYADAQATYDRGRIQRDFGYGANGQVDPNNPYSRAALLDRNFKQGTLGDTTSYAAQGQLYAGSRQNAANSRTFGYLSDSNSLHNQYSDALNQTSLNQLGAYSNAGSAVSQDKIAALLRALGQG